jgi:hypothetical protein
MTLHACPQIALIADPSVLDPLWPGPQFSLIRFSIRRYSRTVVFSREPEIEISSGVNVPFAVL